MYFSSAPCILQSFHLSIYHLSNIWWRLQITVIILGPKYSFELRDSNINQQRNLSRPRGRNVNICGEMFLIQNFPLHVLGSTRIIRMLRVSERRTWHSPNLIQRLQNYTKILTQFIVTKYFTTRMRPDTILPHPRQYSFLDGFVTNILRDILSSGT